MNDEPTQPIPDPVFNEDWRTLNPGLHLLYTKTAVRHLRAIDDSMRTLNNFSNLNMLDVREALRTEREKLTTANAAYAEADEILKSIGLWWDCEIRNPSKEE